MFVFEREKISIVFSYEVCIAFRIDNHSLIPMVLSCLLFINASWELRDIKQIYYGRETMLIPLCV